VLLDVDWMMMMMTMMMMMLLLLLEVVAVDTSVVGNWQLVHDLYINRKTTQKELTQINQVKRV
jgi:hypothetical protein